MSAWVPISLYCFLWRSFSCSNFTTALLCPLESWWWELWTWQAVLSNILEYSRSTFTKSWLKISLKAIQRWITFRPAILMGSTPLRNSINPLSSSSCLDSSHCGLTVIFVYRYPMKMLSDIFHREHFLQQHKKKSTMHYCAHFFKVNPFRNPDHTRPIHLLILLMLHGAILWFYKRTRFGFKKPTKFRKLILVFFQPLYLAHSVNIHHSVRSNLPMT